MEVCALEEYMLVTIVYLTMLKTFYNTSMHSKKVEMQEFTAVRKVLCTN